MSDMVRRQLKRGTLEMAVLKLLAERDMYGYQLVTALEERVGESFQVKEGTLYPVLYRLEDASLIEPYWEPPERGVPRKYYKITPQGTKRLQELIKEWQIFTAGVNKLLEGK